MAVLHNSDAFDARLAVLVRRNAPALEVDAAINLYERVRTARAIAESLFPKADEPLVLALLAELSSDVRAAAVLADSAARSTSSIDADRA